MFRIELDPNSDDVRLVLDVGVRQHLLTVLGDWLSWYAGVEPRQPSADDFTLIVELRRLLLSTKDMNVVSAHAAASQAVL